MRSMTNKQIWNDDLGFDRCMDSGNESNKAQTFKTKYLSLKKEKSIKYLVYKGPNLYTSTKDKTNNNSKTFNDARYVKIGQSNKTRSKLSLILNYWTLTYA